MGIEIKRLRNSIAYITLACCFFKIIGWLDHPSDVRIIYQTISVFAAYSLPMWTLRPIGNHYFIREFPKWCYIGIHILILIAWSAIANQITQNLNNLGVQGSLFFALAMFIPEYLITLLAYRAILITFKPREFALREG
jgi:hypothetical protein